MRTKFLKHYFARRRIAMEAEQTAEKLGVGVGELVKALTDSLGIEQCPRCKRWQAVLDRIRVDGWKVKWGDVADRVQPKRVRVTWL